MNFKGYADFKKEFDLDSALFIDSGGFSKVLKCKSKLNNKFYAIKCMDTDDE